MIPVVAGAPLSWTQLHPVGRLVAGAPEAAAIHESFQRMNRMSILALPVGANTSSETREQVAGQVRHLDPGQHQKARVVGQQPQVRLPRAAHFHAAEPNSAQPTGRPARSRTRYRMFSPTVLRWPK